MKRFVSIFAAASVAILLASACTHLDAGSTAASAPAKTATTAAPAKPTLPPIKLMSWNLEHFVDPFDDPYVDNEKEDAPEAKSDAVLKLLAEAIRRANPDVISFQEVEGDRAIKLFLDAYLPDHDYKYFASVPAKEWYQNVAVASRYPIGPFVSFREVDMVNEQTGEVRNNINNRLMGIEINVSADYTFTLYDLHLKAGGDPADNVWRMRQIDIIKNDIDARMKADPRANIVVVGDLNYTPTDPEYPYFLTSGATPLTDPFAELGLPPTHPSSGPRRAIDHVFFNGPMLREYVPLSASVASPLALDEMSAITDHLPVVASVYPENL